ncbi:MAG: zf-TFIIB domain-containing protein [Desulfatitalea sp.]|nr:zf-TFIIB domain-containing protein [Desulfatitalea sp.]
MKCPHCDNSTSEIGKKCVHCGKDIRDATQRDRKMPVKCPICKNKTEIISLSGVKLDYCYKCNGFWFDKGEIKRFHGALSDKSICKEMKLYMAGISVKRRISKRSTYLKCPVCSMLMSHKRFIEVSDIILDRCRDHGTWAEQEDLLSMIDIIDSDQIDELMLKERVRKQHKLDERIKKIEANQSRMSKEIAQNRRFTRAQLLLDFLGFS